MTILEQLSKKKAQLHRAILIVQVLSPILMFIGALAGIQVLIILGLIALVVVNLLAIVTA
jgi:hypothetical protein